MMKEIYNVQHSIAIAYRIEQLLWHTLVQKNNEKINTQSLTLFDKYHLYFQFIICFV